MGLRKGVCWSTLVSEHSGPQLEVSLWQSLQRTVDSLESTIWVTALDLTERESRVNRTRKTWTSVSIHQSTCENYENE